MNRESGYTLVETLVAMALFLGVLIPVLGMVAGFLFDQSPDRQADALLVARNEAFVFKEGPEEENVVPAEGGFMAHRKIERVGALLEVSIAVRDSGKGGKTLVMLHRSILSYPE